MLSSFFLRCAMTRKRYCVARGGTSVLSGLNMREALDIEACLDRRWVRHPHHRHSCLKKTANQVGVVNATQPLTVRRLLRRKQSSWTLNSAISRFPVGPRPNTLAGRSSVQIALKTGIDQPQCAPNRTRSRCLFTHNHYHLWYLMYIRISFFSSLN